MKTQYSFSGALLRRKDSGQNSESDLDGMISQKIPRKTANENNTNVVDKNNFKTVADFQIENSPKTSEFASTRKLNGESTRASVPPNPSKA